MPRKKRYFSEDDLDKGVTAAGLKRLPPDKQKNYLLTWFGSYYEDPANETPYNSEEGGYLYPWGGPYDAREELESEFGSFISKFVIDGVVDEVESDGIVDWAPGRNHSDHERAAEENNIENQEEIESGEAENKSSELGLFIKELESGATPNYGGSGETEQRRIIKDNIIQILQLIPRQTDAGIGHNNPPLDGESTEQDAITALRDASEIIKAEIDKPTPDALKTALTTQRLQGVQKWLTDKLDKVAEGFARKLGENLATTSMAAGAIGLTVGWSKLNELITNVVSHVSHWLAHVISVF